MRQVIRNAKFVNGQRWDIVVEQGDIVELSREYRGDGQSITIPENAYLSAGWIDLHTHAFPKYRPYGAEADEIGWRSGVTTVVDAGTVGANDVTEFHAYAQKRKTRVLSFLNISRVGLAKLDELSHIDDISLDAALAAVKQYPSFIIGLKARMSASVIGENGLQPLVLAKKMQRHVNKPLMVHIGSAPPKVSDILHYLEHGDIVTHCFNGKSNNLFDKKGKPITALLDARRRGVLLDVGHGTASFSFPTAECAKRAGVALDTISTDLYEGNKRNGPVFNMATTLTKFLALGVTLETCVQAVTEKAAMAIGREDLGIIQPGAKAEFTVFELEEKEQELLDSHGNKRYSTQQIKPIGVYLGGEYHEF